MVESGFEQQHDPLAGGEIEIKEAAKPAHNRGATGHHPEAAGKAPAGLPVRVSSSGQTDCLIPKGIQSGGKKKPGWREWCLTICDGRRSGISGVRG
jgi:hypothetical protein